MFLIEITTFEHIAVMIKCVCARARVAAAAWLSPPGHAGCHGGGSSAAAGQRRCDAQRFAGRCGAP